MPWGVRSQAMLSESSAPLLRSLDVVPNLGILRAPRHVLPEIQAACLQLYAGEERAPGVYAADRGCSRRAHGAEVVRRHAVLFEPLQTSPAEAKLLSPRRMAQTQDPPGAPRLSSCNESI